MRLGAFPRAFVYPLPSLQITYTAKEHARAPRKREIGLCGGERKIHLKKCIFTFSENVTNYVLLVGVQNVNEERKKICSSIHLKGKRTCVMCSVSVAWINGEIYSCEVHLKITPFSNPLGRFLGGGLFSKTIKSIKKSMLPWLLV